MELDKNVDKIELLMTNIKEKLCKLQLPQLYHIQKVITKQIQEVEHTNRFELNMDMLKANLKIKEIYKVGGIGVVLLLETISPGYVRCGFNYKAITSNGVVDGVVDGIVTGNGVVDGEYNTRKTVITIKQFENNFCPSEFEHPNNNIIACVKMNCCSLSDLQKDMILEAV